MPVDSMGVQMGFILCIGFVHQWFRSSLSCALVSHCCNGETISTTQLQKGAAACAVQNVLQLSYPLVSHYCTAITTSACRAALVLATTEVLWHGSVKPLPLDRPYIRGSWWPAPPATACRQPRSSAYQRTQCQGPLSAWRIPACVPAGSALRRVEAQRC